MQVVPGRTQPNQTLEQSQTQTWVLIGFPVTRVSWGQMDCHPLYRNNLMENEVTCNLTEVRMSTDAELKVLTIVDRGSESTAVPGIPGGNGTAVDCA